VEDDPTSLVSRAVAEGAPALRLSQSGPRGRASQHDALLGDFKDALVAPLVSGERAIGALVAMDREEELDPFDGDDLRLFEALAGHATANLERARLVEELRHEAEAKAHQATHDPLTGLPNRLLFLSRAAELLADTGRVAVAILDLDRFKDVNDTLGHEMGDRLLCEIAERLVRAASGRATVARLGGDEFALVVADITGPEEAVGIVRDLDVALSRPVRIDGLTLAVTASAGMALAPDHGDNVAVLLQRADIAMYLAKERRSDVELYSASRDQSMQRRLMLGGQLVQALEAGDQLSLMYQPIARLTSGEVIRVEALARWLHPTLGWIPATEFIGLA
ncbi:MAG: diguanylate cyclase domain-containing protein, partial [Acidimicrobiales bacterium]